MNQTSILERAFALAQSGECGTVADIRRRLKEEQFGSIDAHLAGRLIKRQLSELCLRALQEQASVARSSKLPDNLIGGSGAALPH